MSCVIKEKWKNVEYREKSAKTQSKRMKRLWKSDEFKEKMQNNFIQSGKNNPMHNKSVYDIWVEKYGKEIADIKLKNSNTKKSISSIGENNPMYGKPFPTGSGNGWSGWYKNFYFRSLMELSFIINFIEKNNLSFENGEQIKYQIKYQVDGINKTYYSDFIIDNVMYEIKPKKLWESKLVKIKSEYAKKWCLLHNMKYQLYEPEGISNEKLLNLYNNNLIKFVERYDKKFKERFIV